MYSERLEESLKAAIRDAEDALFAAELEYKRHPTIDGQASIDAMTEKLLEAQEELEDYQLGPRREEPCLMVTSNPEYRSYGDVAR